MKGEADGIDPAYVAGIMDALGVQPKVVAVLTGLAPATISRLRTGSRTVNQKQLCQILIATGRVSERNNGTKKVLAGSF